MHISSWQTSRRLDHPLHHPLPHRHSAKLQLEAQVQYRLGNYREAITLYNTLFSDHKELQKSPEVIANLVAACALGGRSADIAPTLSSFKISSSDGFEIGFNAACGLIEEKQYKKAEEALLLARRAGEELLYDEEMEEEEIEAELAPITAQLAYLAAIGSGSSGSTGSKVQEAIDTLRSVVEGGSDQATTAVAAIDLAASLLRQHPGDRKSALEGLKVLEPFVERSGGWLRVGKGVEGRLGIPHCEALLGTYTSCAIVSGKTDIAREALRSLDKFFKGSMTTALLQAALLARDGKSKEASAILEQHAPTSTAGSDSLPLHLIRVQLAASRGDTAEAAALLASVGEGQPQPKSGVVVQASTPAVLATRAALLEQSGDVEGAQGVLREALRNAGKGTAAARWALRRLAVLSLRSGDLDGATKELQALVAQDEGSLEDPEVLGMLPRVVACCEPGAAGTLSSLLAASVPRLPAAEVDALEAAGAVATRRTGGGGGGGEVPIPASQKEKIAAAGGGASEDTTNDAQLKEKKKKKRKRKIRYPKGFDPENPGPLPDAERWLPKWERSDAKKARKKRRDKEMVKGSQGAGKVDASLDASTSAAAAAAAGSGGGGGGGGGGKSNKKKKGRR